MRSTIIASIYGLETRFEQLVLQKVDILFDEVAALQS